MAFLNVEERELVLTTPNRKEILNEGPPQQTKSNFLGKGAFGTVFKAIYQGKEVAVKVVRNDHPSNCLMNEANVIGWRHKHIVKVLQIESTPKFGIIIMERFPGHCLQKILDCNVNMPLEHKVFITLDIVSALKYCHKQKVLHLDVKPQNILIVTKKTKSPITSNKGRRLLNERNYICKLCDFGGSQKLNENKENPANATVVKGTVRYMAPEVLRKQPLTSAADVYSLGITMWQLKTKKIPYHWLTSNEVVAYLVVKENIRPDSKPISANCQKSSKNEKSKQEIDENCYCTSLLDNHIYQSVEHIKYFLNSLDAKAKEETQKMRSLVSRTLDVTNLSSNIVRDLNFNEVPKTSTASLLSKEESLINSSEFAAFDCFSKLFRSRYTFENQLNKTLYEGIYKLCWHKDYNLRPTCSELQKRLTNLF